jgi:hypothetical protein
MTDLVRFRLSDRGSVLVEVQEGGGEQTGPVGRGNRRIREMSEAFEEQFGDVRDAAVAALETFRQAKSPDEIKIVLGVKLTAEAGAVIAKTSVEGTFNVELVWRREPARP